MPFSHEKYQPSALSRIYHYFWSEEAMQKRPMYLRYLFAIILLYVTTEIKLHFITTIGEGTPFLLYFGVVILSSGYGGIGPGIFATISSAILSNYYFISPYIILPHSKDQFIKNGFFIFECLMLIALSGALTRAGKRVKRSAERFRAMIENSHDAIAIINSSNKVLYASPSTEKVTGYTANELLQIDLATKVHPDEVEALNKFYEDLLKVPGKSGSIVHQFMHKNGGWIWIESTITNLFHHPDINGIVSNFRNVTDKVLLEKQKDDFIGIATHELKTPVTSIKAFAQILLRRFKKEDNKDAAQMIEKLDGQINKLTGLIGDLLDVTKIEGKRLALHEEYYKFNELIMEITEELQRTSEDHLIIVKPDSEVEVFGDRDRIAQVFTNLITNAIKYSPPSTDIIVTTCVDKSSVKICVEDSGVGISREHQAKVFERFYRVSGPDNQSFPGLGLGLYISHEIVKRQGGKIWVESELGKGSTFCFSLPFDYRNILQNT